MTLLITKNLSNLLNTKRPILPEDSHDKQRNNSTAYLRSLSSVTAEEENAEMDQRKRNHGRRFFLTRRKQQQPLSTQYDDDTSVLSAEYSRRNLEVDTTRSYYPHGNNSKGWKRRIGNNKDIAEPSYRKLVDCCKNFDENDKNIIIKKSDKCGRTNGKTCRYIDDLSTLATFEIKQSVDDNNTTIDSYEKNEIDYTRRHHCHLHSHHKEEEVEEDVPMIQKKSKNKDQPDTSKYSSNHIMINQARIQHNIKPLIRSNELDYLARIHAEDMAKKNQLYYSTSIPRAVQKIGQKQLLLLSLSKNGGGNVDHNNYDGRRHTLITESNIAKGKSIRDIHMCMMFYDTKEKENILNPVFTHMGMATARVPRDITDHDNIQQHHQQKDQQLFLCQMFVGYK